MSEPDKRLIHIHRSDKPGCFWLALGKDGQPTLVEDVALADMFTEGVAKAHLIVITSRIPTPVLFDVSLYALNQGREFVPAHIRALVHLDG